jgi:hypothetical protein
LDEGKFFRHFPEFHASINVCFRASIKVHVC